MRMPLLENLGNCSRSLFARPSYCNEMSLTARLNKVPTVTYSMEAFETGEVFLKMQDLGIGRLKHTHMYT